MVARGEIWWYEPPDDKPRPFLLMTRDAAIPVLHRLVGVPTTRTIRDIPTEVRLGTEEGLPTECALALDNIAQIYKAFLTRRITTLATERMREVCAALQITLAC